MKLSKNFTLQELTKSQTAIRNNIDNTPSPEEIENLQELCVNVLQPIREVFGPVFVSSGFRSLTINSLTGGSANSYHVKGMAADIEVASASTLDLFLWIKNNLPYTELILEFYVEGYPDSGWVHVAYDKDDLKKKTLVATKMMNGRTKYEPYLE